LRVAARLPGLYGPDWVWPGQCGSGVLLSLCPVDDRREAAVEVGSSRAAVELLSMFRQCRVPPSFRTHASVHKEMVMVTTRPRGGVLVGGEAWWWCSIVSGLFCGQGSRKIHVGLSDLDAVPSLVASFLSEGRLGNPWSNLLRVLGKP
jgi:hypothetical protein